MNIFEKLNNFFEKHNDFDNEVIVQQISNILDEYKERPSNPHEIIELFFHPIIIIIYILVICISNTKILLIAS